MKNQSQILPGGKHLSQYVSNLFSGSTDVFFTYIVNDADEAWWKGEIENIIKKYEDPAEQLHRFSECIRINVIEAYTPELKELFSPYNQIIFNAIYDCDSYAIAKELMKQYNEKLQQVEV